jgi:hypothetical protein
LLVVLVSAIVSEDVCGELVTSAAKFPNGTIALPSPSP